MPKVAIYDPYLNTLGGGERYLLSIAEILLTRGWQVDLFWSGPQTYLDQAQKIFSLKLDNLRLVPDIFNHHTPLIRRLLFLRQYDLVVYVSDGSLPFLSARQNIVHVQTPLQGKTNLKDLLLNQLKLLFVNKVIFNSQFTLNHTGYIPLSKSAILYPPVDVAKFKPGPKQNLILSVGRFDNILNAKKQDVLIKAFKQLVDKGHLQNWKLVLAGGSVQAPPKNRYLHHLRRLAQNYPIEFVIKPDFASIKKLYSSAKIFWHAAGYQVDANRHPEATEHFGIVVVEAMASGAVPLVVCQGGLPEIVKPNHNGFLWQTLDDLREQTIFLTKHPQILQKISTRAIADSQKFSKTNFQKNIFKLISTS